MTASTPATGCPSTPDRALSSLAPPPPADGMLIAQYHLLQVIQTGNQEAASAASQIARFFSAAWRPTNKAATAVMKRTSHVLSAASNDMRIGKVCVQSDTTNTSRSDGLILNL